MIRAAASLLLAATAWASTASGQGCAQSDLPPWKLPFCEARKLFFAGRFADAEPLFRHAWEISLQHAQPPPGLPPDFTARNYQGLCLQYQDRLLDALDVYDDVLAMQAARDPELIYPESRADALNNAAWVLYLMGRYEEARDRLDRALPLAPARGAAPDLWLRGRILTSRGAVSAALGDHSTARQLLKEATTSPVGRADFMNLTRAHGLLGRMEEAWGRPSEAMRHYQKALAAFKAAGPAKPYNVAQLVDVLGRLGRLEARLNRGRGASAHLDRALEIARRLGSRALLARALLDRARAHADAGTTALAVDLLSEAEGIARASGQPVLLGEIQLERGALHLARGELAAAVQNLEAVVGRGAQPPLPEDAARAHGLLAEAWQRQGDLVRARGEDRAAIDALEKVRIALLPEADRWRIREQFRRIYAAALARLAPSALAGDPEAIEEAFDIAERTRARSLAEDVALADLAPQTRTQQRELARWEERILALAREIDAPDGAGVSVERMAAHRKAIDAWDRFRRQQRRTAEKLHVPARSLKDLRPLVAPPGHGVLAYFVDEARSYAWLVTATRLRMAALPGRRDLGRLVTRSLREWQEGRNGSAESLAAVVLGPFVADLVALDALTFVGSGPLERIPFDGLRWSPEPSRPARYLLETHTVTHIPSLALVPLLGERAGRQRGAERRSGALVYAATGSVRLPSLSPRVDRPTVLPPLAFVADEVAAITEALGPGQVRRRLGAAAHEEGFRTESLGAYRIVHIGAHGWVDERSPAKAGLVLGTKAATEGSDGILTVAEILDLSLGADLVVLSGCDTGRGPLVEGEGMVSVGRAFLQAGASAVVMSLWEARDAGMAALMKDFYRGLRDGAGPAASLRAAKLAAIRSGRPAALPAAWAMLVAMGDAHGPSLNSPQK